MPRHPACRSALPALVWLASACAGADHAAAPASPPPAAPAPAERGPSAAGDPLVGEVEAMVSVAPAQHLERRTLAGELVADWRREAGTDKDADAVVALLRKELADKLAAARGPDAGLEIMRAEVYDRRARALSRRSLALGKAVIDHAIDDADARAQGQRIMDEVKPLAEQVRALHEPDRVRVLSNDLQEVSLEATFAIARGATSRRLSDYQASKAGAPSVQ